jgi:predicted amidohydrolase
MKIALIQQFAGPDRRSNLNKGLKAVEQAAAEGAQLIAYAELAFEPFYPQQPAPAEVAEWAEAIPGPCTDALTDLARKHEVVILPNLFEIDGEQTFDTTLVIDANGDHLGKTRMVHVPEYPNFHEQTYYTPGDRGAPVFDTAVGKIGVAICYDRHFPEYMRALAVAGAELVVIPQAGTTGEWPAGLYQAELQVAAFQNGYFTALCNRVGLEDQLDFSGESFVCDPAGRVIATAGQGREEILYCDLDLSAVATCHARQLFLPDRRPELYASWLT